jgi:hypothetical protein
VCLYVCVFVCVCVAGGVSFTVSIADCASLWSIRCIHDLLAYPKKTGWLDVLLCSQLVNFSRFM